VTFEQLYEAVADSQIDAADWDRVEERLPWVPEHQRWDRCSRLRTTVARLFMERRLWPRTFAYLTTSDQIFTQLMEEVFDQWGGRRFLRDVEDALRDDTDPILVRRRGLLHDFRDQHRSKFF
jgi:hypothetical protein